MCGKAEEMDGVPHHRAQRRGVEDGGGQGLRLSQDREAEVPMLTEVIRAEWELGPQLANNELSLLLIIRAYLASGTVPSILHA